MKASIKAVELIKGEEGFRPLPYKDVAGKDTIGYGTLIDTAAERAIAVRAPISKQTALELALKDLARFEAAINRLVKVKLNQNQFDALCSLVYNIGEGDSNRGFEGSSLLKNINAGKHNEVLKTSWLAWNKAFDPKTGKTRVYTGLTKRREREFALYTTSTAFGGHTSAVVTLLALAVVATATFFF